MITIEETLEGLKIKARGGNNFAQSLVDAHNKWGRWTPKQQHWAEKLASEAPVRGAVQHEAVSNESLIKVIEKFKIAKSNGIARPKLKFSNELGVVQISLAPDAGRNIGHLYVKLDGEYEGKINPLGQFWGVRHNAQLKSFLMELGANPEQYGKIYGQRTGNCCFCARELTTTESTTAGYGPVCAERWGLPWG